MDLSTTHMGIELRNPLMVGASPLSDDVDAIRRMEDAGAGAIVMRSLFMEQIAREQLAMLHHVSSHQDSYAEALSYYPETGGFSFGPQEYLEQVSRLKSAVSIPVIGSLNGVTAGYWTHYAGLIQEAGADGLELNVYYLPLDGAEAPADVEQRYLDVLAKVREELEIPVAMKLTYFFSSPVHFAKRLDAAGADGLVLFNRLFPGDIVIDELEVRPVLHLSDPHMLQIRLLWLAAVFGHVEATLSASGGVQTTADVIKAVMAGASSVQMTSVLLKHGPEHMAKIHRELKEWMEEHEYESIRQMHGSMSRKHCPDPDAYERANYMRTLQSWRPAAR